MVRENQCKPKAEKFSEIKRENATFLSGGRGGLIVNTASAAGLVFNQVSDIFSSSIFFLIFFNFFCWYRLVVAHCS